MNRKESKMGMDHKKPSWPLYALGFALVLNILFYGLMRQNAIDEFKQVGSAITKEANQGLKIWISEQRKVASLVAISPSIQAWVEAPNRVENNTEAIRYLRAVITRFSQFENVSIERIKNPKQPWKNPDTGLYELDSFIISGQEQAIEAIENSGTIEAILAGKSYYISSITRSVDTRKPIFYFSIPIMKNNEILGIITFTVKMSYFTDALIHNVSYRQTGYMFLVDDRGETIAHVNTSYILSDEKYLVDIVNELLTPLKIGDSYFRGKFQEVWKLYYGVPSSLDSEFIRNQWYIVFTQKEMEVYSQANRFIAVMSFSSLLLLVLLILHIYKLERFRSKLYLANHERLENELLQEKLRQKTSEIVKQINMDQLTGIGHFQSIQRHLEQLIHEIEGTELPLTLVLFQVDELGAFNKQEGYALGDIILNVIGKLLKDTFEWPYTTGRLYGNVFGIVLRGRTLIESLVIVEQFRTVYEEQELSLIQKKPSLSFGLVQWQGEKSGEMILSAEQLLKKCKKEGPRQIKY